MAHNVIHLTDFSGGLDLVSSLSTIPEGFTPNSLNMRLSDSGGVDKVTGYEAFATLGAAAHELVYYEQRDGSPRCLVAAESTAWQKVAADGTVTNIRTGLNAATETTFVQHEDKLYGLDRANIMASWDGTTLTTHAVGVSTGPKLGIILGVWQNRLWVAPATGMRVEWSDPEAFTTWPADQYVELGGPGTSDKIVGGMPTPDGLLVFTDRSTYLIYDDTAGRNRLVDSERGCSSRKSLAFSNGTVFGVCDDGIFATNGQGVEIVSPRIAPVFEKGDPDLSHSAGLSWQGSYLASLARSAATNDYTFELIERTGSLMAFEYPAYCYAMGPLSDAEDLVFFIDASDRTRVRKAFTGGSFAGTAISCYYETPLNPLGDETHLKRFRRARIVGRGDLAVGVRVDHDSANRDIGPLDFPSSGSATWDSSTWGSGTWSGHQLFEGWVNVAAVGRRFTLRVSETSSLTTPAREIFDEAIGGSVGGAGVDLIEGHFSNTSKRRQL